MAAEDYDDDFEPDDELDSAIDSFLGIEEKEENEVKLHLDSMQKRSARSRIEDYMEKRRLRDEDIDFDFELEEAE